MRPKTLPFGSPIRIAPRSHGPGFAGVTMPPLPVNGPPPASFTVANRCCLQPSAPHISTPRAPFACATAGTASAARNTTSTSFFMRASSGILLLYPRGGAKPHGYGCARCSTRRCSRRTTSAGSIRRSSTRTAAYAIGRAFVDQFSPATIAVGRDMRVSGPSMAEAVRRGAADGGANVLDLGMVGTEMLYFAVGELGLDGGIAVTASHNPKQYTGMKIVRAGRCRSAASRGCSTSATGALAADWRRRSPRSRSARKTSGRGSSTACCRSSTCRAAAAADRDRRRERDGRRDAAAGARAAADARRRALLLRAGRDVPEPRAEPASAREPRVHHPEDARGGRRLRCRIRRRR